MALMRLLLLALLLGSWASMAGACAESHDGQPPSPATAQTPMPAPCAQIALHYDLPTCECPGAMVALRTASSQSGKFVSLDGAGAAPPGFLRQSVPAYGHRASAPVSAPATYPVYLITSRLRL